MPKALVAGDLARRLVERAAERYEPGNRASAAHAAFQHTYLALARSIGSAGAQALLTRALGQAHANYPMLKDTRIDGMSEPGMSGISDMVAAHGEAATTRALHSLLESLLALLGRLIGDDMVARLVEPDAPQAHANEKAT